MRPPEWPATLPADPRSLRAVREELLSRGLLAAVPSDSPVRPVIERSWRRCVADAVPTDRGELPHSDVSSMTLALRDAAAPVVERMSDHLGDLRVGLFVSNDRGQIVMRKAQEIQHRQVLDRAYAAEGFDYSEESVGTNGMGTVLVERRPVIVHGAEHYSDLLEDVTCAATPIFEPFTRRLLGTFSLACATRDSSPLMYGLTTDVGRQIEANLASMLGSREQGLIRAYLMAENGSRDPVLVLTERTVFANTVGVPHLDSTSHAVLWNHLANLDHPVDVGPVRVPVSGGWREALVENVEGGRGQQPAWCIRLLPESTRTPDPGPGATPSTRTRKPHRAATGTDATATVDTRCALALDGPPGSGKMHRALALVGDDALVLDVSALRAGTGSTWSTLALDALQASRPVILQHLEDLDARDVNRVRAVATAATGSAAVVGLVLTWSSEDAPAHVCRLVESIAPVVKVPALADQPHRTAELVTELLAELAAPAQRPRLSSAAVQCLLRWPWPGNVAELRAVLSELVDRMPGSTISQADLPARLQQVPARRGTSLMESAERQAIVTALQQGQGNRSRAADLLGIGRSTLYRKMQQMHIDS